LASSNLFYVSIISSNDFIAFFKFTKNSLIKHLHLIMLLTPLRWFRGWEIILSFNKYNYTHDHSQYQMLCLVVNSSKISMNNDIIYFFVWSSLVLTLDLEKTYSKLTENCLMWVGLKSILMMLFGIILILLHEIVFL